MSGVSDKPANKDDDAIVLGVKTIRESVSSSANEQKTDTNGQQEAKRESNQRLFFHNPYQSVPFSQRRGNTSKKFRSNAVRISKLFRDRSPI